MEITYKSVLEKFKNKGFNTLDCEYIKFITSQTAVPVFDPSCIQLLNKSREELHQEHKKQFKEHYEYQQEQLEYWNTWIDYQKHK